MYNSTHFTFVFIQLRLQCGTAELRLISTIAIRVMKMTMTPCAQPQCHLPMACSGLRRMNVSHTSTNACVCSGVGVSSRLHKTQMAAKKRFSQFTKEKCLKM